MSEHDRIRAAIEWWEQAVYMELTVAEEDHVRALVEAARRYLACDSVGVEEHQ